MRIRINPHRAQKGYALLLTLGFVCISVVLLGSISQATSDSAALTARNIAYNNALSAAESATEVTIAKMNRDFVNQTLSNNMTAYKSTVPTTYVPSGWTTKYEFTDANGGANQTDIVCTGWEVWTNLNSQFTGLYGLLNTFQVTATARDTSGLYPVSASVRQTFELATIPVFQFAIYYNMDLEINPLSDMRINGKVHGNANIYMSPSSSLDLLDNVTYTGNIQYNRHPDDPNGSAQDPTINFAKGDPKQISSLTLPIAANDTPEDIAEILDAPEANEDPQSDIGRERLYNRANLIITTTDTTVTVKYNHDESGEFFDLVPTNNIGGSGKSGYTFINTNVTFWDYRENKRIVATEIDIAALTNWLNSSSFNTAAQNEVGHKINSVYVDDQRTVPSSKITAIRVTKGRYLPSDGLSIFTPRPLYVRGHFNAPDTSAGSTNTAQTKPAALAADAITVLSSTWSDAYSQSTQLSSRPASDTTVNAGFLAGIVSTKKDGNGNGKYSGGVQNFPRFLEDWNNRTMTYNGSMVVLFESRFASSFWKHNGYSYNCYNPPNRQWGFDLNFTDPTKLPPGTPQVKHLQRGNWSIVAANNND